MAQKTWSPVTRLAWLIIITGVAVQWWRWALIIATVNVVMLLPLALLAGHRGRSAATQQEDELEHLMSTWQDAKKTGYLP